MSAPRKPLLTSANKDTLDKLTRFITKNGRYPTNRELGEACGVGITAAVFQVKALKAKGVYPALPEANSEVAS